MARKEGDSEMQWELPIAIVRPHLLERVEHRLRDCGVNPVANQLDAAGARNTASVAIPAAQVSRRSRFGRRRTASVSTKR